MIEPIHSKEAEECVVGGLMCTAEKWDDVSEILSEEDFYFPVYALLFSTIRELLGDNQPVDVLTVAESLDETQFVGAGGLAGIMELLSNVPSASNVVAYAEIVKDHAILRSLQRTGEAITALSLSKEPTADLVDQAEALVGRLNEERDRGEGPVGMSTLLSNTMNKIDTLCANKGSLTGLTTGFGELDTMTTGLQNADLIIVAGRPSMGKSAFMMNLAEAALLVDDPGPVVAFSLEMPHDQLMVRMLSGLGRVDSKHIRSGSTSPDEMQRLMTASGILHSRPLFIDDAGYMTPTLMRSRLRKIERTHGKLGLVVVDYLQLMNTGTHSGDNRVNEISEISRSLKGIAKEFDCPVVAGSQLNRGLEQRQDKRPIMSDLRESGAIEQDADIVLALYRDEVYYDNSPDKGLAEVLILKQRNGEIGRRRLAFLGQYTRFEDIVPDTYTSYSNQVQQVPQSYDEGVF